MRKSFRVITMMMISRYDQMIVYLTYFERTADDLIENKDNLDLFKILMNTKWKWRKVFLKKINEIRLYEIDHLITWKDFEW